MDSIYQLRLIYRPIKTVGQLIDIRHFIHVHLICVYMIYIYIYTYVYTCICMYVSRIFWTTNRFSNFSFSSFICLYFTYIYEFNVYLRNQIFIYVFVIFQISIYRYTYLYNNAYISIYNIFFNFTSRSILKIFSIYICPPSFPYI